MKAPKYQRMEMLQAAISAAGQELSDPIEGLEVTDKGVVAWANGRIILLTCHWDNGYSETGQPLLGSGAWSADYAGDCDSSLRPSGNDARARHRARWRFW
jgi:hypothetical protein